MRESPSPRGVRRVFFGAAVALALAGAAVAQPSPKASAQPPTLSMAFQPKTYVDGVMLQVIIGERALLRLDSAGNPVLEGVEKGQLAAAHPAGTVTESFKPPAQGQIAMALDGSGENRATSLKVWNGTGRSLEYKAIVLVLKQGQTLQALPVPTCPVAPGHIRLETWPAPVVAVGLSRFKPASSASLAQAACNQGK